VEWNPETANPAMDDHKPRQVVRVELTEEQKKQLREQTGQQIDALELSVEELEPRITPRSLGTFL
jgi:hypothetical protein